MKNEKTDQEQKPVDRMGEEEAIREKVDKNGYRWIKVYFGGGVHLNNWLSQFIEIKGKENIEIEEADSSGFQCYEESSEKMYRIWIKETGMEKA